MRGIGRSMMRHPKLRIFFVFVFCFSILLFLSYLIRDIDLRSVAVVIVLAVFATAWFLHTPSDSDSSEPPTRPDDPDGPDEPDVPYDPGRR